MNIVGREKARALRKQGKSINQIVAEAGLSKASVSVWVRDIVLTKSQKSKITERGRSVESVEKRRLSRLSNEYKKTRAVIDIAKLDITSISIKELKIIGAMIYLGEGGKTHGKACVANSDPLVIKMMMKFFREVCHVPEKKFYGHIHTFDNADVEKTEKYWSQITKIPRKQFYKTYIKQSTASLHKRKTLPYGTCDIGVCDTKLFLTIMGWIEKIKELVLES
jgi:hypothetical protein